MNIIVIGGGNHHNALGVIRALGERGYGVELITIGDIKKHYVSSSRYVRKFIALADIKELAAYMLYRPILEDKRKEIVISCADVVTEQLNIFSNRLSERYILPGVPEEGKVSQLMDKIAMISIASKRGIYAPPVWDLYVDKDRVSFPCITKTLISSRGGGEIEHCYLPESKTIRCVLKK